MIRLLNKTCNKCKKSKTFDNFYRRKDSKDGFYHHCKQCQSTLKSEWYKNNSEKVKNDSSAWYQENKARRSETHKKWVSDNQESYKAYQSSWFQSRSEEYKNQRKLNYSTWARKNPEKVRKLCAAYRARKLRATPTWFGELDDLVMTEAYHLIGLREIATGFSWNVDHMFPLKGNIVCGLHVWNNIQVIPETVNKSKSNRMIFNYSLEWLNGIHKFNYEN